MSNSLLSRLRSLQWTQTLSLFALFFAASPAFAQFPLFQRAPYIVEKARFDEAIMGQGNSQELIDRLTALQYDFARYDATIQAGSSIGVPPDTPDARIDPNTSDSKFAGVASLEVVHPTLGTFVCTSATITDFHVLSAAHCFDLDDDGMVDPGLTVSVRLNAGAAPSSTHSATADKITIHPDYGGFSSAGANDDLAIVQVGTAFPAGIPRYPIRLTPMTSGEVVSLVGYGQSGNGDAGYTVLPTFEDKRSGQNVADLFVVDDEGTGTQEIFMYDFDGPTAGLLGGPTLGNDIETKVGGGDSGGPAFIEDGDGNLIIAGVSTFEFSMVGVTGPRGVFGSFGGGIDISSYAEWVDNTVTGVPEPSAWLLALLPSLIALSLVRKPRSHC